MEVREPENKGADSWVRVADSRDHRRGWRPRRQQWDDVHISQPHPAALSPQSKRVPRAVAIISLLLFVIAVPGYWLLVNHTGWVGGGLLLAAVILCAILVGRVRELVRRPLGDTGPFSETSSPPEIGGLKVQSSRSSQPTENRIEDLFGMDELSEDNVAGFDGIVWEADARSLRMTFINRHAETLLGYPGNRWLDEEGFWACHIHPADRLNSERDRRSGFGQGRDEVISEYRMIAADGREVYLRDRIRQIVRPGEAPEDTRRHLRGVAQDITMDRSRVDKRRAEHDPVRKFLDVAQALIVIVDSDQRITTVNRKACEILGYTEPDLLGQNWFERCIPESYRQSAQAMFAQTMAGRINLNSNTEGHVLTKDAEVRTIVWHNTPLKDTSNRLIGVMSSGVDVTEHRYAEETVALQQELSEITLASIGDAVITTDTLGHVTFMNHVAAQIIGADPGEAHCRSLDTVLRLADEATGEPVSALKALRLSEECPASQSQEAILNGTDGRRVIISHNTRPLVDARGVSHGTVVAFRDVTAQKEIHQKLRDLNQTLSTINACREAIVHAADEPSLLNRICEILVSVRGYVLVWVGYAEDDPEKHVRPVAIAGDDKGYVEDSDIRWSDDPRGLGPTGTAIRTGAPRASNQIRTSSAFAPWRERAIEHGYESSIALPLKAGEHTFGALNIYADKPNAFASESVFEQLERLVDDIAHAVTALRVRAERERAAEDLSQQKAQYQSLFDGNPHPMWVQDRDTQAFIAMNEASLRVFEYSREEFLSMTVQDILRVEDTPDFMENISRVEDGLTLAGVWRLLRRDGTVIVTEVTAQPVAFDGRQARLVQAVDITEKREAEKLLRTSERRFRTLVNSAPVGIVLADTQGHCQFVNKQWCRFAGITPGEAKGSSWEQAIHPADAKRVSREWTACTLSNRQFCSEFRFRTPTGETTWLSGTIVPIRSENNEIVGYLGTLADIRRRRQLQTSVCHVNTLLDAVVANIPYAICVKEAEGLSYVQVNPAGTVILGRRAEDLIGKSECDLLARDAADARTRMDRDALESDSGQTVCEETITTPAGETRTLRTRRIPVKDKNGTVQHLLLISEDITETGGQAARDRTIAARQGSGQTDPGSTIPRDINRVLEDTIVNARDELYPGMQPVTDFEGDPPPVQSHPDDAWQPVRSLLQGATHVGSEAPMVRNGGMGTVRITTRHKADSVVIGISDLGIDTPAHKDASDEQPSIPVSETGDGHHHPADRILRERHNGESMSFGTTIDRGTACRIRLPADTRSQSGGA